MLGQGFLLYNASAGSAGEQSAASLATLLRKSATDVGVHEFAEGESPRELVTRAVAAGAEWVAIAGGDGTIEAGASALLGTEVPLAIIPCGTYNNFALSAGVPLDAREACELVSAGNIRAIDVGFVNGKPFFEALGVGLEAALFPVSEEIKSGGFHRWIDLFRKAYGYRRSRLEIVIDRPIGEALCGHGKPGRHFLRHMRRIRRHSLQLRVLQLTVSNGPYYGMNFAVAPEARLDDGFLTVNIFKRFNKLALWWHYFAIRDANPVQSAEIFTLRCKKLQIRSRQPHPAHLDGTPLEEWPLDIELRPAALKVFAPHL